MDWDHYESAHWRAGYEWAAENLDHPDRDELLQSNAEWRERYLHGGQRYLGWAIFVARPAREAQ